MQIDNRKDILLLFLYSPGVNNNFNEPITGKTKLVKSLFLFKEEVLVHFKKGTNITEENFYTFFPWNFGPFSKEIYDDMTFFVLNGFISVRESDQEPLPEAVEEWNRWISSSGVDLDNSVVKEYQEEEFSLTIKGEVFARDLYGSLTENQKKLLKEFKSRMSSTPTRAIIRYVYKRYPNFTEKSKIKDQFEY